ncbi:MAG: phosphodiester glycosidase family protein [Clostridiales Family XIII bacterium]|jgi:hypothetical protein|nr:phosphodiester glycosidase family protein [Clostridiales Family XIII bacterium]
MIGKKILKAFSVLTLVFVFAALTAGFGSVYAATNTVLDVKGGQYVPVLIHNGMTDVASVEAYAQAKGAFVAINATYFDAYATEDQVTAKGGDVNVLRAFGALYGAPLNFPSGVLIENGKLIHGAGFGSATGQWGGYLGAVTKQGTFIVEQVTLNLGFIADGNKSTVWRVNHPSYEDTSVTLYDESFGRDVQLKPGDKAVIAESGVIKDIVSYGPVKVPAGGFIVVASASANVFYGNKNIDSFSIGQQASWSWEIDSPNGYNFKDVYFAVGSDTAKINGAGGTTRPYIGGTADGSISVGVGNAAECVNALFLDGGGSVAYYKDGKYLNGPGRNVSNAIGFVSTGQSGSPAAPANTAPANTAQANPFTADIGGAQRQFQAFLISDSNYVMLRDLAYYMNGSPAQFEVSYDANTKAIGISGHSAYTAQGYEDTVKADKSKTYTDTSSKIFIDGKEVTLQGYNIEGSNYFKLRDLAAALNFDVDYRDQQIYIEPENAYTAD